MDYYPLFLKLANEPCIVVGGGKVALRKVESLLEAGARVTLVSPAIEPALKALVSAGKIKHTCRKFEHGDITGQRLVIATTGNQNLNRLIAEIAESSGILVNVPDDPEACRFIVPAIVDRSPLMIAISTAGQAPVLARLVRQKIEALYPASYGRLSSFSGRFRDSVKKKIAQISNRRKFWEAFFTGPVATQVLNGQHELASTQFLTTLEKFATNQTTSMGEVYIVGAGPGDPDLLTLKALRLMQQADIVFYDNLVSKEVLNLVRRDATRVSVAKTKNYHKKTQTEINQLLVSHARAGERVCRLKGGDAFIFARGGEELETLVDADIPFQVVPGITAASGCTAYAGIPLTHREYADTVVYVTGHKKNGEDLDINFSHLVDERQTLVFYMGLGHLQEICARLQINGMDSSTPAAVIENGTSANQRSLISTVNNLARDATNAKFNSPTLIVVGQVVQLAEKLHWFGLPPIKNREHEHQTLLNNQMLKQRGAV